MGDTPTTVNEAATIAERVISFIIDQGLNATKAALVVQAPYLGWPVISQVTDFILAKIGEKLKKYFATRSTFLIIDFQSIEEKDAYLASVNALIAAKKGGKPDEISEAERLFKEKAAALIHNNGWVHH